MMPDSPERFLAVPALTLTDGWAWNLADGRGADVRNPNPVASVNDATERKSRGVLVVRIAAEASASSDPLEKKSRFRSPVSRLP